MDFDRLLQPRRRSLVQLPSNLIAAACFWNSFCSCFGLSRLDDRLRWWSGHCARVGKLVAFSCHVTVSSERRLYFSRPRQGSVDRYRGPQSGCNGLVDPRPERCRTVEGHEHVETIRGLCRRCGDGRRNDSNRTSVDRICWAESVARSLLLLANSAGHRCTHDLPRRGL